MKCKSRNSDWIKAEYANTELVVPFKVKRVESAPGQSNESQLLQSVMSQFNTLFCDKPRL